VSAAPSAPALFPLGAVVATPGALRALTVAGVGWTLVARHVRGDWGTVSPDDARENELSVREGFRIVSSYTLPTDTRIWVITEGDRSATTLLLPGEY
jgi:hypothetical protein